MASPPPLVGWMPLRKRRPRRDRFGEGVGEELVTSQCTEGAAGPYTYEELRGHSHFFEPFAELQQVVDELLLRGRQ